LLDCYRDIRYSVSPRFELETAVSKLSWLSRWISPTELGEAVESARSVFGNAGVSAARQVPQKIAAAPAAREAPAQAATASASAPRQSSGNGRSLSDEFKRMLAAKGNGSSDDEEDVPLWDSAVNKKTEAAENSPQIENVLSVIPGTVVE
jgi:DNA polymerase-3 subunit gamma/tau